MDAGISGMWNQLRFNVDQAPSISNLVSQVPSRRPGPVVVGPNTPENFAFVDSATLEIAQRLARRDVQRMRESQESVAVAERNRAKPNEPEEKGRRSPTRAGSPVDRMARPVARLCRRERQRQQQQEQRQRQREEQLRHRKPLPPTEPRAKARAGTNRSAKPPVAFQVPLSDLPARGDSPPVRDTDPQPQYASVAAAPKAQPRPKSKLKTVEAAVQKEQLTQAQVEMSEIRAQHQELMATLRELARAQNAARASPTVSDRSQPSTRPRGNGGGNRLQTHRIKLWGGNRPAKGQRQRPPLPASDRSSTDQRKLMEEAPMWRDEAEEEDIKPFRSPRLLNDMPDRSAQYTHNARDPGDAEEVLEEVRRLLMKRRNKGDFRPLRKEPGAREEELTDWLLDEVARDAVEELQRIDDVKSPLPGNGGESLEMPTLEEMAFRLQEIETETDAIRDRWRTIHYEDIEEEPSSEDRPLVFENRAMLFTKRPTIPSFKVAETLRVPRPPTTVPLSISRASARSISKARQRYLDWNSDRPGPRFSVDLFRVADWIADDVVDEVLAAAVSDIDHAGDEIVQLLFDGEMAPGDDGSEQASHLEYSLSEGSEGESESEPNQ